MSTQTHDRKIAHINIVREKSVEPVQNVFDAYRWPYKALPEVDLSTVDAVIKFFGKPLSFPFIISSMTGGAQLAEGINKNLAIAAEEVGVALGLGSMRIIIENPDAIKSFAVRDLCPSIPLFANMGLVQLNYGYGADEINRIIDAVDADGIFLHVNPLQEAVQPEGDTNFAGLIKQLEAAIPKVEKPIIVKEVGTGIDRETARQLREIGVEWIDVSGMGGTSWTVVEGHRREDRLGETFAHVGMRTDEALNTVKDIEGLNLIAGGGVRSGLDIAKSLALGATLATAAKPLLEPALESAEACVAELQILKKELEVAMFVAGVASVEQCQSVSLDV